MAEVEAEHALAATVDAAELCSVAEPDHFVSETTLLEEFERARLDAGGARSRGRGVTLVDQAHGHAHPRQFQRRRKAGRPRAGDQDGIRHDIPPFGKQGRQHTTPSSADNRGVARRTNKSVQSTFFRVIGCKVPVPEMPLE